MKDATELLKQLAAVLTEELLRKITDGTASPSDLNVARQWLKDNSIELTPANPNGKKLGDALGDLPFDDGEDDAQGASAPTRLPQLSLSGVAKTRAS